MQLKNNYYYFQKAISPDICRKIIDIGIEKVQNQKKEGVDVSGTTFGDRHRTAMRDSIAQNEYTNQQIKQLNLANTYVRDSEISWLNDQWLYDLFCPLIAEANNSAGWQFDIDYNETFQFTIYRPGGFYGWHRDGSSDRAGAYKRYIYGITREPLKSNGNIPEGYVTDPKFVGKIRKISMTCNLNVPGEYEGGNLKFDFGNHTEGHQFHEVEEIRPQGSVVIFPSFLPHCVTPVTKGTRYSLVLWTLGKPFK